MEVPDRSLPAPRGLTGRAASLGRTRAAAAIALAATLLAALAVVLVQPVRSPWWTYADADATYTASGLNLLLGEPIRYLDHPGLPLEELIAVAFGADYLLESLSGDLDRREYVDRRLLDLDRTRPFFRGFGMAFYLAGALLSFVLIARLFGHWGWGLAGGLLWLAAPGLTPMAIQFRPDVLLAVLCLVVAYLLGRALETRSAGLYAAAGLVLGVAVMVKMHAAGLVPALALAVLWRPPRDGWSQDAIRRARAALARHRIAVAIAVFVWLGLAVALNLERVPFRPSAAMLVATVGPPLLAAAYLLLALRGRSPLFHPGLGLAAVATAAGLLLPVTLVVPEGMQSLVNVANGLVGRGINQGSDPFGSSLDRLLEWPLRESLLVFLAAGAAAVVGLRRREPQPVVWFVGALALGLMAQARLGTVHYFAPAFVVSVPAALWLFRHTGRRGPLFAAALVAVVVTPSLVRSEDAGDAADRSARAAAPALAVARERLAASEVALTPPGWPAADVRYFELVEPYVAYTPDYPYRLLPASPRAASVIEARGLEPAYFLGSTGSAPAAITFEGLGTFHPVPVAPAVLELRP